MVRGDPEDMVEEKVEKLKKKKKKQREEERERALKDGQQGKMRNGSKKEGIERMLKCASRDAQKAATGNYLNGKVRGNKKRREEAAVSLQEEECDLTLANVEETDEGKCNESEKSSETSAEEAVLGKKRKTQILKRINESEEGGGGGGGGGGGAKMGAGVLGGGGSESKTAEEGKAERQKKIKKRKMAGEELHTITEHGQGAAKEGAGVQVAKKRSKKVRAEASNAEEKWDEISSGGTGSPEDKDGAGGSGVVMSEKTRKKKKTKKVKDMGAAADLGNGEEEKSVEKVLEKERKKKKVPVQESRTGMGAGGEGEDGNKGITGVEEAQEGNGEETRLKKKKAGVSGPRGGEKEKRGKKGVMKGEKKREKGNAQAGEEDVAGSVPEEEEERKKKKKKRKAQAGEEDVAGSVQEEEGMKNSKTERKTQAKGGGTAVVIQETMKEPNEEERVRSGSGKGQSGSQETAPSKGRRKKSEGGQEAKTSSEGSAAMEDQEGGVLNIKRKKKRRKSDRDKVECEDSMRTEQGEVTSTSRRKQQIVGTPAEEMNVVFLSEKMGNKDEVTIDQERRQALQNEIDMVSCPRGTQMLGQWGSAHFENANQQQKFLRLMGGFKKGYKPTGSEEGRANMALGKEGQQRLQQDLLAEFDRAQSRRMDFQNKGVGLGFSPQSNKKFFIDVNASRSVRFDD